MNYEIIDNFLPRSQFKSLKLQIEGDSFPWNLIENRLDSKENLKKYCTFKHTVYENNVPQSMLFSEIDCILQRLEFRTLLSINAHLYPIGESIIETPPIHEHMFPYLGMIYYFDNCDGYTIFDDNLKIESVANRAFLYEMPPERIPLIESNCTDKIKKTNITFTYF